MPQGFSFSKKPDYEKRRAKGFRLPFFGTRQGGTGMAFAGFFKGQNSFRKRAQEDEALSGPKGTPFLQSTIRPLLSPERPCGADAPQGRIACRRQNMAQHCRTASPTHILGENSRSIYPAYHRGRRRRRTEDKTLPHTVSRLQRYMRYIINDLRRRPFFPPHMGCPGPRAASDAFPSNTAAFRLFPPPMRRLRAEMDAIAHARDNSRPSDGCPSMQAFGPAGALWPLPNPRLEHRPQLVRNPAFFSAAGKADAPLFYAR